MVCPSGHTISFYFWHYTRRSIKTNYTTAQSQLFCKIAPNYSVIIWRNRAVFVILANCPKSPILNVYIVPKSPIFVNIVYLGKTRQQHSCLYSWPYSYSSNSNTWPRKAWILQLFLIVLLEQFKIFLRGDFPPPLNICLFATIRSHHFKTVYNILPGGFRDAHQRIIS